MDGGRQLGVVGGAYGGVAVGAVVDRIGTDVGGGSRYIVSGAGGAGGVGVGAVSAFNVTANAEGGGDRGGGGVVGEGIDNDGGDVLGGGSWRIRRHTTAWPTGWSGDLIGRGRPDGIRPLPREGCKAKGRLEARPRPTKSHPNCQACGGPPGCVTEYPEHGIMIAHCYDCDLTYDLHDAEDGA